MKKRIISFLMALVMAVSLLPVSAFAVGDETVISVSANGQSLEVTQIGTTHFGDEEYDGGLYLVKVPAGTEKFQVTNSGKNNYLIEMEFCLGDGTNNEYTLDNATNEGFTDFIAELTSDGVISVTDKSAFADSSIRSGTIAYSNEADGAPVDILIVQEKAAGGSGNGKMDAEAILATEPIGTCTVDLGDGNETLSLRFKKVGADVSALTAADNEWSFYDTATTAELSHYFAEAARNDTFFKACVKAYNDNKAGIETDTVLSNNADHLLMYAYNSNTEDYYMLLLEWEKGVELTDEQKKPLADLLATVADGNTNYYQSDDRWNGKTASKTGFWAEFTAANGPRAKAQKVLETAATEEQITTATAALQAAIANLIPADRANTTLLYEELQNAPSAENYTVKSWAAYKTARDKAEALMATMFDAEGNPTDDNKATANESIEKLAAELTAARKALDEKASDGNKTIASLNLEAIRYLAKKYDPDTLTGYTDESIQTLRDARTAALALADKIDLTEMGQSESQPLETALRELRKAVYGLTTTSAAQIKVNVSVLDANDIYAGYTGELARLHNLNTYTAAMTLPANASAYDLLNGKSLLKNRNIAAEAVVFLNGELVYGSLGATGRYHDIGNTGGSSTFQAIKLHDGDALTLVWIYPKQIMYSSQAGTYPAYLMDIPDYFRYSTISAPIEVEAGKPFSISVTSEAALPFHCAAGTRAVTGAAVYRSDAAESAEAAANGYVGVNTYAVTDESGKATLTLYNEGYVLLNAFRTDIDEARYTVGASVLVHVTAAGDLDAVKQQLREKLDAVYNDEQHPESVFTTENWQKVQDAYNTAVAAIDAAKTSGAAGDAQQKAIQTIKGLQSSADYNNTNNLKRFRTLLDALPDDVSKLDVNVEQQIKDLKACYEAMTVYQRSQLTAKEQKKYDAVIKALADGLSAAKQYKLTFKQQFDSSIPAADQAALADMIAYLQNNTRADDKYTPEIGGNMQAQLFSFNTTRSANYGTAYDRITEAASLTQNIVACVNPDYAAYLLCRDAAISAGKKDGPGVITGDGWRISDESTTMYVPDENVSNTTRVLGHMTYTVNGKQYAIRSVTVSGLETDATKLGAGFYDASLYKGRGSFQCNQGIPDTFLQLTTGFNDVTVTVTWAPVDGDTVQSAKDSAISRLTTVRNGLKGDGVQAAYDVGVAAINAAKNAGDVDKAYQAAVKNMQAAATSYGKVRVIVENKTFPKSDWGRETYWYGEAVNTEVPLTADSTMMSCVVAALAKKGFSQTGAESNYISSITVHGCKLAEFDDGGGNSGWMGTLNDWFTNEGFGEFTVANGKLSDGDVIRIMYTRDLGVDLDGTWGNSNTTLQALKVQGGELMGEFTPGEPGGSYEYVLAINGAGSVQLTPTAANKNYLTKMFLNEKVTSDVEGVSFYKRTQSIPVKDGDVIYIGCGEKAWPSMNKQGAEAREYTGTWYALRVVDVSKGASTVESMIDDLPEVSSVKYGNYQLYVNAVAAARASFDALNSKQQKRVDAKKLAELEKLEAAIAQFQAIDEVKDKLDKLPNAGSLTINDRDAVKAAKDAYDKLTPEQKEYLSFAQSDKMKDLTSRMDEIIKENPTPTPTPGGNTGNNSSAKNPYQKDNGKDVKSGNTGDAGITLYVGMALVAVLAGAVIITRKRKEN